MNLATNGPIFLISMDLSRNDQGSLFEIPRVDYFKHFKGLSYFLVFDLEVFSVCGLTKGFKDILSGPVKESLIFTLHIQSLLFAILKYICLCLSHNISQTCYYPSL